MARESDGMPYCGELGLSLICLDAEARREFGITPDVDGVLVVDVSADSTAARRGLRAGDVIVMVGHTPVKTPEDVARLLSRRNGNKAARLLVKPSGEQTDFLVLVIA